MITTRSPRTRQPQGVAPVSLYWRSRGLQWLTTRDHVFNLVTGRQGDRIALSGTQVLTPSIVGVGSVFSGGYAAVEHVGRPPTTSNEFTLLFLGSPYDTGSVTVAMYQSGSAGRIGMFANSGHNEGYVANQLALVWIDNDPGIRVSIVAPSTIDGGMHCWMFRKTVAGAVWRDGQIVSSTDTGNFGPSWFDQADTTQIGCGPVAQGGSFVFGSNIVALASFNRGLSDGECLSLSRNPWQLFAPFERSIWVPGAGGSLPTLSSATYVPGSITSVGFRPRVTAS